MTDEKLISLLHFRSFNATFGQRRHIRYQPTAEVVVLKKMVANCHLSALILVEIALSTNTNIY